MYLRMYIFVKASLLLMTLMCSFNETTGRLTLDEKEDAIRSIGMDTDNVELIDEVGTHGECVIRTPCQIILKNKRTGACRVMNVNDGIKCNDPRCAQIAKSKGAFEQHGDQGICMLTDDIENGLIVKGRLVTSRCFCNAGS